MEGDDHLRSSAAEDQAATTGDDTTLTRKSLDGSMKGDDHLRSSAAEVQTATPVDDSTHKRKSSVLKTEKHSPDSPINDSVQAAVFDDESHQPKLKYPKSVFFIVVNEFCERFTFYGLRTLLAVYCNKVLHYSVDTSTVIYHSFVSLAYFTPLMGAFIADSFLGKFKTIMYLSIVYAIGNVTLTLASADTAIDGMPTRAISILGLVIIAIGTGGIKPCVSAFGGDQFVVPQQQPQVETFFSIFYFAVNSGSLVSTFLTPILREDVQCFGKDSCYPLAYGVPAVLMFIAIIVFLIGKPFYVMKKPEGNIVAETLTVIKHSLATKRKSKEKKDHWLDYGIDKFGEKTVSDIKAMLRVAYLFIPLPIFWALYDQQGSRWTFQASRMNGQMGGFTMQAEQMQVVNPFLILLFVPLFEMGIYPLLAKCNLLTKPLTRLGFGGVLAGVAFLLSAFVELGLEPTYAVVPKAGEGQLRFFNAFDCPVKASLEKNGEQVINALGMWELEHIGVENFKDLNFDVALDPSCAQGYPNMQKQVKVTEQTSRSYLISNNMVMNTIDVHDNLPLDDVEKTDNTKPKLRVLYTPIDTNRTLKFYDDANNETEIILSKDQVGTDYYEFRISSYKVTYNAVNIIEGLHLEIGAVYSLLLVESTPDNFEFSLNTVTDPNSIHIMWLMPQYIVMTAGEVMFSVTGLQFSFTQAPVSMKAVLTSAWLMTSAVGNVIVAIIAGARIFENQMYEFLLFAGIMFLAMIIFAAMAWNYEYVVLDDEEDTNAIPLATRKSTGVQEKGVENKTFENDHND